MIIQPFAFRAGQEAAPTGWDPTLGGTVTPDYWWDLQDSSAMTLSGTDLLGLSNKGSQTDGDLASTTTAAYPQYTTDPDGKISVQFTGQQRLGSPLTLIPHLADCTVFVAFYPVFTGTFPSKTQIVFGHEGYTYSGNFATILNYDINKTTSNTQQYIYDDTVYGYGTAATMLENSVVTMTRPRPETFLQLWTIAGTQNLSDGELFGSMHTQLSTRETLDAGTKDIRVSNAFDTATMGNIGETRFQDSTAPEEGTAIGQAGRPSQIGRDGFTGYVYQVVVYLQKLSQAQITQLYDGWIADF